MKRILSAVLLSLYSLGISAAPDKKPKLIVGIVVDQMRYDFLTRYWNYYGNDGFKKLVNKGFSCNNTHYNYFPTYTGPGHAAIYTGTTPAINGIAGNNWYVRKTGKTVYVTEDSTVHGVGISGMPGAMSPRNMKATSITDELKAWNPASKVIGIALKDRGAILPAGHRADAAYFLDGKTGYWASSDYYMNALPDWVNKFNAKELTKSMLANPWVLMNPAIAGLYKDSSKYERPYAENELPVFPYKLDKYAAKNYDIIRRSPYGNTLTELFAEETIKAENLGKDAITDFLAISFSSTDYIGHQFGPSSLEIMDTYLRLDKDIARLLNFLDKEVGSGNYLLFLSADHGVADIPALAREQKLPAGEFDFKKVKNELNKELSIRLKKEGNWILATQNDQFFLNYEFANESKIEKELLENTAIEFLSALPGVNKIIKASELAANKYASGLYSHYQRGFYPQRCGDLFVVLQPGWFEKEEGPYAATHGSTYEYDTHVPLIFYGWNIKKGKSAAAVDITDIAPTLAQLLDLMAPSGCTGKPIVDLLK